MRRFLLSVLLMVVLGGCTSVGSLGLITRSTADPASILRQGRKYHELGFVEGGSCRNFLLAIIPWGNADIQSAVDDALSRKGGDAIINATTSNSLYGFIPIYNLFSNTCTRIRGTAIKFD